MCDEVVAELSEIGTGIAIPANLALLEGKEALAEELSKRDEGLFIRVNKAGATWGPTIENYPIEAFDRMMGLNVNVVSAVTRDLLPLLEKRVPVGDPARVVKSLQWTAFTSRRCWKTALSPILPAKPLSIICRGHWRWNWGFGTLQALPWLSDTIQVKWRSTCLNTNRTISRPYVLSIGWGQPEEMAGIAMYLASRAGGYSNQTKIRVDGGMCVV